MAKEFVVLNQQDFVDWADVQFGKDAYQLTLPKRGKELVICFDTKIHGLELHIYTTVVPDVDASRASGEDAIRFVLYDRFAAKPVTTESKVLRVTGDTTPLQRCSERVNALLLIAQEYEKNNWFCKCNSERSHTIERTNNRTGEKFRGCALFPRCNQNKAKHIRDSYPLALNPFAEVSASFLPEEVKGNVAAKLDELKLEHTTALTKISTGHTVHPIVERDAELVSTRLYPQLGYSFAAFNRVQSGVLKSGVPFQDVNFVLGTATSSGKTIAAELVIAAILGMIE